MIIYDSIRKNAENR